MDDHINLLQIAKELFKRFKEDEISSLAAELAYFFLLSLFPFLIFLMNLLAYLPLSSDVVLDFVAQYAPGNTMKLIENNVRHIIETQNVTLLSFGVIGTIWSASNGINAIVRAFNKAYQVEENRHFLVARLMSILLTFAMILVILVALLLPVFGREIGLFIFRAFGFTEVFLTIWNTIRWLLSAVILCIVFTGLYFIAPNKRMKISEAYPGALFATVGWIVVSLLFSYYVGNFGNFSVTYGSLGGVIILLIWFYLSAVIIILGGEINAILSKNSNN
ncbi:MAG: YihY/virulence factor BrkB family protein [Bacillaceae bacterium]|jgi:Predicted membrane protein|uniref:Ribonuclease n=2 Tax=Aeribacillus TaxID=1055323 RepID=A0A164AW73_9BACI|nr:MULTISPECIES: YihY/virulence factor BrkB family protein [Aeribacillus]AXI38400.1 YihY/virulence factor BrkB family protein [Bacillaceae bacterium ZC4]REJ12601.1 MAG: YihY/virulence factor BrkB family protein [Bacillaceae bacterium]KZM56663.1 ribonuclease [Aeribacillus pallidus]KZN97519.1 ribonuclease [Aeribacillus pallidus]MDR9798031.1 YihY/virulence factor BrkB family protein [Aeribacillus pallidus]